MTESIDILAIIIVTLGLGVQAWIGLGFGLLSAPLLYFISPDYVPGPILLLGFVLSALVVLRNYQQMNWQRILPACLARIPGAWCGALLLASLPQNLVSILFGLSLLMAIQVTRSRVNLAPTPGILSIAGFFSGLLGTATSVGGPPMAMAYQQSDRLTTRNDLALFFLITTPVSLIMLAINDYFSWQTFMLTLPLLPGVFLGYKLAGFVSRQFPGANVKPFIIGLCTLAATGILLKGLWSSFA